MISASAFGSADDSYFDLDYPRYQKSLIQWLFIMPSFIDFGIQARGNGGIKGGHSNSTRDKWPCLFRTLLGMSIFDWNLSEILLSKTTKPFVCSEWQITRKTALRQRNLSTIFTGKSASSSEQRLFLWLYCCCNADVADIGFVVILCMLLFLCCTR